MEADRDHEAYLRGEAIYGDDLSLPEIEQWFADEEEGYAGLGAENEGDYRYAYHSLNQRLGFAHLKRGRIAKALGIGSAYGHEFAPIASRIDHLTILDPSDAFAGTTEVAGVPCEYRKPSVSGEIPFAADTFDLITCLGALHHIPNVSFVLSEANRCLAEDGQMLLREPIVSMGDWREPREGLTRHERGIPLDLLRRAVCAAGFDIDRATLCVFPPLSKLVARFGVSVYGRGWLTGLDILLSRLFAWNLRYHATSPWHRVRPVSLYLVLSKRHG